MKTSELKWQKDVHTPNLSYADMYTIHVQEKSFYIWQAEFIRLYGDVEMYYHEPYGWHPVDPENGYYEWYKSYFRKTAKFFDKYGTE